MFTNAFLLTLLIAVTSGAPQEDDAGLEYRLDPGDSFDVDVGTSATRFQLTPKPQFSGTTTVCITWERPDGSTFDEEHEVSEGDDPLDLVRYGPGHESYRIKSIKLKNNSSGVARGCYKVS